MATSTGHVVQADDSLDRKNCMTQAIPQPTTMPVPCSLRRRRNVPRQEALAVQTEFLENLLGVPDEYRAFSRSLQMSFLPMHGFPRVVRTQAIPQRKNNSDRGAGLSSLPTEVLLQIFKTLDCRSIYHLVLTNTVFYNLFSDADLERFKTTYAQELANIEKEHLLRRPLRTRSLTCYTCFNVMRGMDNFRTPFPVANSAPYTMSGSPPWKRQCCDCTVRSLQSMDDPRPKMEIRFGTPFPHSKPPRRILYMLHRTCGKVARVILRRRDPLAVNGTQWSKLCAEDCELCADIEEKRNLARINWLRERDLATLAEPEVQEKLRQAAEAECGE